jgi:hypothetical protein
MINKGGLAGASENPKISRDFQKKTSAFSASSWFILFSCACAEDPGKEELDSQKEKRTTNRRNPGGRRGDKRSIKRFISLVFWKKTLCGLCVLCG